MLQAKENPKLGEELARRSNAILKFCEALVITDDSSYAEADKKASETKALEKGVIAYWDEPKSWAHKSWKAICGKENQMLTPIKEGGGLLTKKMSEYRKEREALEAAKRKEEEEKKKLAMKVEALKMAEDGVEQVAVDAVLEMAEEPSVVRTQELRGKTSFTVSYEVRMIPGEEWRIPKDILEPTTPQMIKAIEAKVKAQAKFTGGKPVKGFEIIQTETARRKSL